MSDDNFQACYFQTCYCLAIICSGKIPTHSDIKTNQTHEANLYI